MGTYMGCPYAVGWSRWVGGVASSDWAECKSIDPVGNCGVWTPVAQWAPTRDAPTRWAGVGGGARLPLDEHGHDDYEAIILGPLESPIVPLSSWYSLCASARACRTVIEDMLILPSYAMIDTVSRAFNPSSRSPSSITRGSTMFLAMLLVNSFQASASARVTSAAAFPVPP